MPIDMSFVHTSEFKASEAGKTYWDNRMALERKEREENERLRNENRRLKEELDMRTRTVYYILIEEWAVYVKEGEFFRSQGGLTEPWGEKWVPVMANSINDAHDIGVKMREERR